MEGVDPSPAPQLPPVSRAARIAATALLVAGLGIAVAAGVVLRPAGRRSATVVPASATSAAPVTVEPTPTPTSSAATSAPASAAPVPATTVLPSTSVATTAAAATAVAYGSDGWWRTAVVATTLAGTVEVWTPAGRLATVDACADVPGCSVASAVVLADAVAVIRYGPRGAEVVRLPLDGAAAEVLPAGALVDGLAAGADGASLWWLTRPPTGGMAATVHRWPGADGAQDIGSAFRLAPSPTGDRLAWVTFPTYDEDGIVTAPAGVLVRDERTGAVQELPVGDGIVTSVAWTPDGSNLVVQLADEARVVEVPAGGEPRVRATLPFVATCVDTDRRVLGVRRVGEGPSMRHVLGEAALPSGAVRSWDVEAENGSLACRGDGAAVLVTFPAGPDQQTELRVRRADGRDTLLGRGYAGVGGGLGGGWFSTMSCGGEGS